MSLINDALKRAKQAQQQRRAQLDTNPPFRNPEEPLSGTRLSLGRSLGAAGLAVLCILFVWLWIQKSGSDPTPVQARTEEPAAAVGSATATTEPAPVASSVPERQVTPAPAKPTAAKAGALPTNSVAATPQSSALVTNTPLSSSPNVLIPQPEPLKLQAVIYNPRRPSAIINGRTLFIGDRCGEMRVVRINPDSAVLAGRGGVTNVLRLSQ